MGESGVTKDEALAFLRGNVVMTLATASKDGRPQIATIYYVVDDDFGLRFFTREGTRKDVYLKETGLATVSIGQEKPMNIRIDGRVEVLTDETERKEAMVRLAEAAGEMTDFWPPVMRMAGDDYVVYRLNPEKVTAIDLTVAPMKEKEPPFIDLTQD